MFLGKSWFDSENKTETPNDQEKEAFDELDKILKELV